MKTNAFKSLALAALTALSLGTPAIAGLSDEWSDNNDRENSSKEAELRFCQQSYRNAQFTRKDDSHRARIYITPKKHIYLLSALYGELDKCKVTDWGPVGPGVERFESGAYKEYEWKIEGNLFVSYSKNFDKNGVSNGRVYRFEEGISPVIPYDPHN